MKLSEIKAGDCFRIIDKNIKELNRKDRRTTVMSLFDYNETLHPNIKINDTMIHCDPNIEVKLISRNRVHFVDGGKKAKHQ